MFKFEFKSIYLLILIFQFINTEYTFDDLNSNQTQVLDEKFNLNKYQIEFKLLNSSVLNLLPQTNSPLNEDSFLNLNATLNKNLFLNKNKTLLKNKKTNFDSFNLKKNEKKYSKHNQLVVISFDAMRYDYPKIFFNQLKNFAYIADNGVWASLGMETAFITKTFPTHYTIATGLYEESHGIIDNTFYDPILNETFSKSNMKKKFFSGEPIWTTCAKSDLTTKIFFWPCSDLQDRDSNPLIEIRNFNKNVKLSQQINKVKEWIDQGVDLSMFYYYEPDFSGHNFGIGSDEMKKAIKLIDYEIGRLLSFISKRNVNLIILGDHGMVNLNIDKLIVLDEILDFENEIERIPQYGNLAAIQPKKQMEEKVMNKLSKVKGMKCYLKKDIPEYFYYKNNPRIMPIICLPDLGGFILKNRNDRKDKFGSHGYDSKNPKMRPIFYAIGPDFKKNLRILPFQTVNLYSLFTHILRINPAPNNGSIDNLKHILSNTSLNRLQLKV